jgi:hypothetical protein
MNAASLDRAVLSSRLAQIAQLMGAYGSKTDQTAQSDHRVEVAHQFGPSLAPELTARPPKLTSGTARRQPDVQAVGAPLDCARARSGDRAPPL